MTMKKWKRNEGEKVQRSMVINCEHQNSPGNDQEIEGGIRGTDRGKGRSSQGTKGKIGNGQQNHKIDLGRRGRVQMSLEIAKNEGAQEIYRKREIENEGSAHESQRKREKNGWVPIAASISIRNAHHDRGLGHEDEKSTSKVGLSLEKSDDGNV